MYIHVLPEIRPPCIHNANWGLTIALYRGAINRFSLYVTRWLPGFARVPYHAPRPCLIHTWRNCHHIRSFHPPVKQYITTLHNRAYIVEILYRLTIFNLWYQSLKGKGHVVCSFVHYSILVSVLQGTSVEVSVPPYLPSCDGPPLIAPLPLSVAPSLLRSLPPSPLPLATYMHSSVPSSLVPSLNPPSLPIRPLPPSLASLLHHSIPLLPPSPPSPSSLPPTLHPSSLLPFLSTAPNSMYTVCVVGKLYWVGPFCLAPSDARQLDNGVVIAAGGALSMTCWYIQRTYSHDESVFY